MITRTSIITCFMIKWRIPKSLKRVGIKKSEYIMKVKESIIYCLLVLFTISCSNTADYNDKNLSETKIELRMESCRNLCLQSENPRAYYQNEMTSADRFCAWQDKLSQVLTQSLTESQSTIVQTIKSSLLPEYFTNHDENSQAKMEFYALTIPNWISNIQVEFNEQDRKAIFGDLNDFIPGAPFGGYGGSGSLEPDCDCSKGSMFNALTCWTCWGNSFNAHYCHSTYVLPACGFLGFFSCNGLCTEVGVGEPDIYGVDQTSQNDAIPDILFSE